MPRELGPVISGNPKRIDEMCSITFYASVHMRERIKRRAQSQGINQSRFLVRLLEEALSEMDERDFDGERVVVQKAELTSVASGGPKTYDARTGVWK